MAIFDRNALNEGVRGREVLAWSSYDFANSGYTTVVLTAVFNAYFVGVVADGADWGTLAWTAILGLSNLAVLLTMPAIGAVADRHASKKRLLGMATLGCVLATAGLAWCGHGDVALAMLLIVISNYFYSMGEALCGAFLPELARPAALGRVSGWGWSFGYLGGMLALGLSLAYVVRAQQQGATAEEFVPVTMWITAAVYALAALPIFLVLRERAQPRPIAAAAQGAAGDAPKRGPGWLGSLLDLQAAARRSAAFPDFRRLLWTGAAYQAGISVVIALAAVYAEQVMGFQQQETMALVFLVNIASAGGAFLFGYAEDRIGHKPALALTLVAWIVMVLIASFTSTRALFWVAATLAGLCMGSSQSCGRALVGVLAPSSRRAEFYGLWAFATRLAAVVGPLTYGLVNWLSAGNHRLAFLSTGLFFVLGLLLLARLDLGRGARVAAAATAA
jgi:UMF1 family MFS transporter